MPEIAASVFHRGRPTRGDDGGAAVERRVSLHVRLLHGLEHDLHHAQSRDRLEADLRYLSDAGPTRWWRFTTRTSASASTRRCPIMERIPAGRRSRYVMESALAIMKPARLAAAPRHQLRLRGARRRVLGRLLQQSRRGRQAGSRQARAGREPFRSARPVRAGAAGEFPVRAGWRSRAGACGTDQGVHPALRARLADDQHPDTTRRDAALRSDASRRPRPDGDAARRCTSRCTIR